MTSAPSSVQVSRRFCIEPKPCFLAAAWVAHPEPGPDPGLRTLCQGMGGGKNRAAGRRKARDSALASRVARAAAAAATKVVSKSSKSGSGKKKRRATSSSSSSSDGDSSSASLRSSHHHREKQKRDTRRSHAPAEPVSVASASSASRAPAQDILAGAAGYLCKALVGDLQNLKDRNGWITEAQLPQDFKQMFAYQPGALVQIAQSSGGKLQVMTGDSDDMMVRLRCTKGPSGGYSGPASSTAAAWASKGWPQDHASKAKCREQQQEGPSSYDNASSWKGGSANKWHAPGQKWQQEGEWGTPKEPAAAEHEQGGGRDEASRSGRGRETQQSEAAAAVAEPLPKKSPALPAILKKLKTLQDDNDQLQEKVAGLEKELEDGKADLAAASKRSKKYKKEASQQSKLVSEWQVKASDMTAECNEQHRLLDAALEKIGELERENAMKESRLLELQGLVAQSANLERRFIDVQSQLNAAQRELRARDRAAAVAVAAVAAPDADAMAAAAAAAATAPAQVRLPPAQAHHAHGVHGVPAGAVDADSDDQAVEAVHEAAGGEAAVL